jgi:hypothetical protein
VVFDEGLIGAVPGDARAGDSACVLMGCIVPVCLRKIQDSDNWIFAGECYADAYMDGEAIQWRDDARHMPQLFISM